MPRRTDDPPGGASAASAASAEALFVQRLRDGDEQAFVELIDAHHPALSRFLRHYLPNDDLAEDVAQETWVAVLGALPRFEGRSSLKTWLFRIGLNRARARMRRERRLLSFSSLSALLSRGDHGPDSDELLPAGFSAESGMWVSHPARWDEQPETVALSDETVALVRETIQQLPPMQAAVVTLRDIDDWTSAEVCEALDLSEANQRVLLHRARVRIRKALESAFEGGAQ